MHIEGSPTPIKELLIEATFAKNRAIRDSVTRIDLGVLGSVAERLSDKGRIDAQEWAITALVTQDNKLLLSNQEVMGDSSSVTPELRVRVFMNKRNLPRRFWQDRFIATLIHNHPVELPPSPKDLGYIFLEDSDPSATTAVFIASPGWKTVIFRGAKTPQLTNLQSAIQQALWIDLTQQALNSVVNRETNSEHFRLLEMEAQRALIMSLSREYDLRVYGCPIRENIAIQDNLFQPSRT